MAITTPKKRCKQSKNLTSEKTLAAFTTTLKKMQNNGISKIMNKERLDISPAVYSSQRHSQRTTSVEKSFSMLRKLLAKDGNVKFENVRVNDFRFQFLLLVIAEVAAYIMRASCKILLRIV